MRNNGGSRHRTEATYGLLHYVLAAYVFPSEGSLADDLEVHCC